jgi:hypothetical protein
MPALKQLPPGTALHSQVRRRIWKHPELRSHSLLVLTLDQFHLAPLAGPPKPEMVAAVEAGGDLNELFGPLATVVKLASVRRVRLDLLTNSLIVEYAGSGSGTSGLTVVFATPEAADACFTKVWRRLGEGCDLLPYQRDTLALARAPLAALAAVLIVTLFLALALNLCEELATARSAGTVSVPPAGPLGAPVEVPKSPLETLLGWLNWKVVCGVGGVAAAVTQVWLYRRLTQPPGSLELIRA